MVSNFGTNRTATRGVGAQARAVLQRYASRITANAAMDAALRRLGKTEKGLDREGMTEVFAMAVVRSLAIYLTTPRQRLACREELMRITAGSSATSGGKGATDKPAAGPVRITIDCEADIVRARRDARAFAADLGLDHPSTIKVATAVSELARNIYSYAGEGTIEFGRVPGMRVGIRIVAEDHGPGIRNLDDILEGSYRSKTGMGFGLRGSRNVMDSFDIQSELGKGTRVEIVKYRF